MRHNLDEVKFESTYNQQCDEIDIGGACWRIKIFNFCFFRDYASACLATASDMYLSVPKLRCL